jgi:hypothetical protein
VPLNQSDAKDLVRELLEVRGEEMVILDTFHDYVRGSQMHPVAMDGMPSEVYKFVELSRINVVDLVIEVMAQSLYVDGYRPNVPDATAQEESMGWLAWQANKLDSRQTAVARGAFTYGVSYVMVLPSEGPVPTMRGYSPRKLTVVYGDDPDWPYAALHVEPNGDHEFTYTLYDAEAAYRFTSEGGLQHVETNEYGGSTGDVCPVVRFLNIEDLDDETTSEVERLIPVQDQIDVTTFGLMVAQHYQAFLQRYVIGWEAKTEAERMKASASRLWTFDDPEVKVGQFQQAQLDGYLRSREDTVQLMAVISQTPPHHLLGELINLSAEALAAAEAGHRRKINQRQTTLGESWEQALALAELEMGVAQAEVDAQVRWRDTEARSLAQTVDALGKMAQMLGIPPEALWEKIPGVTQQDLQLFRQLASEADALTQLTGILEQQLAPVPPAPAEVPPPAA